MNTSNHYLAPQDFIGTQSSLLAVHGLIKVPDPLLLPRKKNSQHKQFSYHRPRLKAISNAFKELCICVKI